jgi:tRNA(His) 5'-end guanylyltransferase
MKLVFDGRVIKVVDEFGNEFFHVAQVTILESNHATHEQKWKLLEEAVTKMTAEEIRVILH